MTDTPGLEQAVDAAARALYDREAVRYLERNHGEEPPPFDAASPLHRHSMREAVLPLVTAAAPHIAAQVRTETLWEAAEAIELIPVTSIRVAEGIGLASQTLRQLAASLAPTEEADRG